MATFEYGAFSRPFKGLTVCGDSYLFEERSDSFLTAVIDGLGHGHESSIAAVRAVEVIRQYADLSVGSILLRCHEQLRPTRGAAVGILKVEPDGRGEFCGVGNIEVLALHGTPPSVFCLAGIVGHNVRTTKVMPFVMKKGDVYCMLSDGVSTRANLKSSLPGKPESVAKRIVEQWGRPHDDATALILGFGESSLLAEPPAGR